MKAKEDGDRPSPQGMVVFVVTAVVLVFISGLIGASMAGALESLAEDDEYEGYFEDQCNERFGYEWEYVDGGMIHESTGPSDNHTIECQKDMGFMSTSVEKIEVPPEDGEES